MGAAVAAGLGGLLLQGGAAPISARANALEPRHLMWAWQFTADAEPHHLGAKLVDYGMGIILKTHDGTEWMAKYDKSPFAVSGPEQERTLATYYEDAGVPFHAWTVVHGTDPLREAEMAAEVLANGARSIFLDVEPHDGFWRGSPADAEAFGQELRRLQPAAHIVLSIDPRPWTLPRLPMNEFVSFSNEIAPQQYWHTFNTPANYERFAETGFPVPEEGVTPEFLLSVSQAVLTGYGLPLLQVGQGAIATADEWSRFIDGAYAGGSSFVTVWRYGVTEDEVFSMLRDKPALVPQVSASPSDGAVVGLYIVESGDTLGAIAGTHGVTVEDLMAVNSLSDPNYIYVGQELQIPGLDVTAAVASGSGTGGGTIYTVQAGDTLYTIVGKFGTTIDAVVAANSLADPNMLSIGQELVIP
jgi:LysM repeat protein